MTVVTATNRDAGGWRQLSGLLPATAHVVEDGLTLGHHLGAQIYVSLHGRVVAEAAVGDAGGGRPFTDRTLVPWTCASKLLTAVAVAIAVVRGRLDVEAPVRAYVPELRGRGTGRLRVWHLLTHTAGLDGDPARSLECESWSSVLARVCRTPVVPGWEPGKRAAYSGRTGFFLLSEVLSRADGRPPGAHEREDVLVGLGLARSQTHLTDADCARAAGDVVDPVASGPLEREGSGIARPVLGRWLPGESACGPVGDLGRLLEAVRTGRASATLPAGVRQTLLAPRRRGIRDEASGGDATWGLGVAVDGRLFGQRCSAGTFGHLGANTVFAFADPLASLVVAAFFRGAPDRVTALVRRYAVSRAVYMDLGLARTGAR